MNQTNYTSPFMPNHAPAVAAPASSGTFFTASLRINAALVAGAVWNVLVLLPHPFFGLRGSVYSLGFFVAGLWLLCGVIALALVEGRKRTFLMLAIVAGCAFVMGSWGIESGAKLDWLVNRSFYQETVEELHDAETEAERQEICERKICNYYTTEDYAGNRCSVVTFSYSPIFLHDYKIYYALRGVGKSEMKLDKYTRLEFVEALNERWAVGRVGNVD